MKCGHLADCIMTDVPYHNEKVDIAACSSCFNYSGTAIQPACNMSENQPIKPLPKIERSYGITLVSGIAIIVLCITILIASICP
jgi:hypothetical protein